MRIILAVVSLLLLSSCLKTRSEVAGADQTYIYGKKNVENQAEAQMATPAPAPVDEKDELIRSLNGRVEVLENQLTAISKEKEADAAAREQKMTLLQEALTKLEAQLHELENSKVVEKKAEVMPSSDDQAAKGKPGKKVSAYETAQEFFGKNEWKKAILSFQKYADESPKGKNVADAKYKIGVCFQELGMKEEAMAFYEEVVANFGGSDAGKKSKARLAKLKK